MQNPIDQHLNLIPMNEHQGEPHPVGACVWYTGYSGAGKSTSAEALRRTLLAGGRRVTLLDGDVVRTHLSKGLGFSREDRDVNVRRIGYVAAELVHHGALVLVAAVSPYRSARDAVRAMMPPGCFIEVHVATPLAECERRDPKGLYHQARRGDLKAFTGVDDPYEPPLSPEIVLDTLSPSAEDNATRVLAELQRRGLVRPRGTDREAHAGVRRGAAGLAHGLVREASTDA